MILGGFTKRKTIVNVENEEIINSFLKNLTFLKGLVLTDTFDSEVKSIVYQKKKSTKLYLEAITYKRNEIR